MCAPRTKHANYKGQDSSQPNDMLSKRYLVCVYCINVGLFIIRITGINVPICKQNTDTHYTRSVTINSKLQSDLFIYSFFTDNGWVCDHWWRRILGSFVGEPPLLANFLSHVICVRSTKTMWRRMLLAYLVPLWKSYLTWEGGSEGEI